MPKTTILRPLDFKVYTLNFRSLGALYHGQMPHEVLMNVAHCLGLHQADNPCYLPGPDFHIIFYWLFRAHPMATCSCMRMPLCGKSSHQSRRRHACSVSADSTSHCSDQQRMPGRVCQKLTCMRLRDQKCRRPVPVSVTLA